MYNFAITVTESRLVLWGWGLQRTVSEKVSLNGKTLKASYTSGKRTNLLKEPSPHYKRAKQGRKDFDTRYATVTYNLLGKALEYNEHSPDISLVDRAIALGVGWSEFESQPGQTEDHIENLF